MPNAANSELTSRLQATLSEMRRLLDTTDGGISARDEAALERWLQVSIQICVDLGDRILHARKHAEPVRQADVFIELRRLGILGRDEAAEMVSLVSVRNALVHDYPRFDSESTPLECRRALPILESVSASLITSLPEE